MAYSDLALAIVTQAVEDYKERKAEGRSLHSLREFFEGQWCATLLTGSILTGQDILSALER